MEELEFWGGADQDEEDAAISAFQNDLAGVIAQAEEARRRDPYDEVALYQEMLAEHKLNHADKSAALVKEFQAAKAHNQEARTKYILQEASPPQQVP